MLRIKGVFASPTNRGELRELERLKWSLEISQREVEERESNQKKSREEETGAHTSEGINI